MEIVAYKEVYKNEILDCLRRNFPRFQSVDKELLERWFEPLIHYKWGEGTDVSINDCPYKYGMVLLEDNKVVGYCGLIYSYQYYQGKRYLYVNPSTWAIDTDYRLFVYKITQMMIESADVIGDFTSRKSMEEMCIKLFRYKYLDQKLYRFLPIPCFQRKIEFKYILNEDDIPVKDIRKIYKDHISYGVKCLQIIVKEKSFYIFYKNKRAKIKGLNTKWSSILDVTDSQLFAEYAHEIIWKIQLHEKSFLESDSRFFAGSRINYQKYKTSDIHRLEYCKYESIVPISLLYSEIAILNRQR